VTKKLTKRLEGLGSYRSKKSYSLTARERRFFDALYEVLPQTQSTKILADKILSRMNSKS